MRRVALIVTISTAAVLFGGGLASAQFAPVLELTGSSSLTWGRGTTYATHISQEWTPAADTMICAASVSLSQQTGSRAMDVGWTIRRNFTTNPETGGTLLYSGTIAAPDIPLTQTLVDMGLTDCWIATSGTKYGFDFYSGQDSTNYLYEWYGGDQIPNGQNWDYVPVTGWTARPTRELVMTLYGSTDVSSFSAYVSSTYGFNDADFGTFGNALVDIMKWLFVPSPQALNVLSDQRAALMAKPPFSWASTASSTLGGLNTGDTTTSTAILWYATSTGVDETISLFTPSDIASKIPSNVQNTVHVVGATVMWAMFFAWIVSLATSGHITDHVGIQTPEMDAMSAGLDDMLTELDDIDALHGAADAEQYDTHDDL